MLCTVGVSQVTQNLLLLNYLNHFVYQFYYGIEVTDTCKYVFNILNNIINRDVHKTVNISDNCVIEYITDFYHYVTLNCGIDRDVKSLRRRLIL